jgi:hypothetical protein
VQQNDRGRITLLLDGHGIHTNRPGALAKFRRAPEPFGATVREALMSRNGVEQVQLRAGGFRQRQGALERREAAIRAQGNKNAFMFHHDLLSPCREQILSPDRFPPTC